MKQTALVLSLIVVLSACAEQTTSDPSMVGAYDGHTYSNPHLGFSITFPDNWWVAPEEVYASVRQSGRSIVEGRSQDAAELVRASEANTFHLFMAAQHELGSPVPENVNISGIAERIGHLPGIKTGYDYLFNARPVLRSIGFDVDDDIAEVKIADRPFYRLTSTIHNDIAGTVNQHMYSVVLGQFALAITVVYLTEEGRQEAERALETLTFTE